MLIFIFFYNKNISCMYHEFKPNSKAYTILNLIDHWLDNEHGVSNEAEQSIARY